jgi:hypothetical protein
MTEGMIRGLQWLACAVSSSVVIALKITTSCELNIEQTAIMTIEMMQRMSEYSTRVWPFCRGGGAAGRAKSFLKRDRIRKGEGNGMRVELT